MPDTLPFGLIPTGWFPTAIELSANGRYLYVANAKGDGGQGSLQRVDLKHTSLVKETLATLRYNRTSRRCKVQSGDSAPSFEQA